MADADGNQENFDLLSKNFHRDKFHYNEQENYYVLSSRAGNGKYLRELKQQNLVINQSTASIEYKTARTAQ